MTTRLSRERAQTRAHDYSDRHLHTPAAQLAGFASKAAEDAATATRVGATTSGVDVEPPNPCPRPSRRRPSRRRMPNGVRAGAALGAMLLAGSAAFVGAAAARPAPAPAPNSVLAFGHAPVLGSGADLELHAGVVGMASNPGRPGYWLAAADGGVFAFGASKFFGSAGGAPLNAPVVGIAAGRHGRGYWLVAADGGVFAFGDAAYYGSMAGIPLAAPVTSIVATRDGRGYWLVAADGGVFAFGDARFRGSAEGLDLAGPIVGAVATHSGRGYWLVGADGGVFSFGDARFAGARPDPSNPAVGIAAAPHGDGYWIAHANGSVSSFDVTPAGNPAFFDNTSGHAHTVAIAASSTSGYWLAQGELETEASNLSSDAFLACTRAHESDGAGGYRAVSAGGTYRGAYQFDRGTWDSAARLAGRPDLVGVDPAAASPADQDLLALDLFHQRGAQPWGSRCSGLT